MKSVQIVDNEVRSHLYDVLEGALLLDDFETWFVGRTWEERTPLVARLDHLLAERSLLDASQFLDELRRIATTIADVETPLVTTTSAAALTIRTEWIHGMRTIRDRLKFVDT